MLQHLPNHLFDIIFSYITPIQAYQLISVNKTFLDSYRRLHRRKLLETIEFLKKQARMSERNKLASIELLSFPNSKQFYTDKFNGKAILTYKNFSRQIKCREKNFC